VCFFHGTVFLLVFYLCARKRPPTQKHEVTVIYYLLSFQLVDDDVEKEGVKMLKVYQNYGNITVVNKKFIAIPVHLVGLQLG